MKNLWNFYLENRHKWKIIIIGKVTGWLQKERHRTWGGITFSLLVHSVAILFFFGMEHLDKPVEIPIREISFIDLSEELPEVKTKTQKAQNSSQNLLKMETNKNLAINTPVSKMNTVNLFGDDKLFLDTVKDQAPIKVEKIEPVVPPGVTNTDVVNILQAKGLRQDNKIKRPAPIQLDKNKSLVLASSLKPNKINNSENGKISLNNSILKTQSSGTPIKLNTVPPEINLNKSKMGTAKTQTFISGPLANRKIVKKIVPPFPLWAKKAGVGATISLKFTVMKNGQVKENVLVERTSGSSDWDQLVIQSLKTWRFVELKNAGSRFDQTGVITFQFVI